jgi:ketosteroid isomerase-like protein
MSEDGVDVVKHLFEAFNRGEVEAVVDAFDPDCELYEPREMPDTPADGYRGHDGIREWMANLRETGGVTFEAVAVTAEGDVVFSEWIGRGTGQTSGVPIEWPTWAVAEIREGKVLRLGAYLQEDLARAAEQAAQSTSQPK